MVRDLRGMINGVAEMIRRSVVRDRGAEVVIVEGPAHGAKAHVVSVEAQQSAFGIGNSAPIRGVV